MDPQRHKTQKKALNDLDGDVAVPVPAAAVAGPAPEAQEGFKVLLEDSAREAYSRPWHRIERGLRLNRLRIFVEEVAPQFSMTKEDKDNFFIFLQKALDKKLLNTLKVVIYDQEKQRITQIRGLEIKRNQEGALKWAFSVKKAGAAATRKRKKDEIPSISTHPMEQSANE
jgi:hypothetical protein